MIGGKRLLLPEILDQTDHVGAKSPIFDLFACSDSAVTPSSSQMRSCGAASVCLFAVKAFSSVETSAASVIDIL